jgi:halimadienyl-diphosphate synthase
MNLTEEFCNLLKVVGTSVITSSAYDTGWVARLAGIDDELSQRAMAWLYKHQLEDGGWGCKEIVYGHDRFICTLSAMLALAEYNRSDSRLDLALKALTRYVPKLRLDPAGATVGFELLVPTLLTQAINAGFDLRSVTGDPLIRGMANARTAKLNALAGHKITRLVTPAFSTEMVGEDLHLLDIDNLQDADGAVGGSPSATAFFALNVKPADPKALAYLRRRGNEDGGLPYVGPIDIFEPSWVLWNLALTETDDLNLEIMPHLDFLEKHWTPKGVASITTLGFKDGDDTSMSYETLAHFGRSVDPAGLFHYEMEDHFRCYELEADASTSTNIHALSALRAAGCGPKHRAVKKALSFLRRTRTGGLFWFDKWHSSPYYPTAHAIMALAHYDDTLLTDALYWTINTQRPDGSWGFYDIPTAEETAYCLQTLILSRRNGYGVPEEAIIRGSEWLREYHDGPYLPLWIGKSLYCPQLVVRSAVLSALMLIEQEGVL